MKHDLEKLDGFDWNSVDADAGASGRGAGYVWIVTRDEQTESTGTIGPAGAAKADIASLKIFGESRGYAVIDSSVFRMYDDDGVLYYEGLLMETTKDAATGFEPLDDFGMPNAGCTRIEYLNLKTGKWEEL